MTKTPVGRGAATNVPADLFEAGHALSGETPSLERISRAFVPRADEVIKRSAGMSESGAQSGHGRQGH